MKRQLKNLADKIVQKKELIRAEDVTKTAFVQKEVINKQFNL
jgi:hypothetical protein